MKLVIYGPTATGKTALAIKLAQKYNGELISADSRQVYKGLDIGTGKVSFESKIEKRNGYWIVDGIRINGFDLVAPGAVFTAADFFTFTNSKITQIIKKDKVPIIVGGTGFYIKSLIEGIDSLGIPSNPKLRQSLEELSAGELFNKLKKIDEGRAEKLNESDRRNPRRLIRAIEICLNPKNQLPPKNTVSLLEHYQIVGLTASNTYLYKKADESFLYRLNHGMVDEIKGLLSKKVSPLWLKNLGLEYKWLTRLILKEISQEESFAKAKGDLHDFIRRQKTWFKQFKNIKMYNIEDSDWQNTLEKDLSLHIS